MTTRPVRACVVVALALAAGTTIAACGRERAGDGTAAGVPLPADVRPAPKLPERLGIGRVATAAEVAAWDIDANPAGRGLPPGSGTHARGAAIYAEKCASCHGERGEGLASFPRLVDPEPRDSFPFAHDLKHVRTIGNYWPYATTVFDYVNRTMPLTAPGSLTPDEVYSLTAFLLAENRVIPRDAVIDAASLPKVRMPARDRFVSDDRAGGPGFK